MRSRVFIPWCLALVLSGCIFQSSPNTTTATTTPPEVVTTVAANGRQVETVDCGDAPSDAEILCEGYTLIKDRYVDRVADEALAQGASEGLDLLDGAQSDGPITCAVPNDAFTEACLDAAEQAEDTAEAAEAMLFGMASLALDPHSAYIDPDLLQLIRDETDGRVEGIGALVIAEDASGSETERCVIVTTTCRLVIVSPIPGSPAEAAGIQHDDEIVGVDGRDIAGLSIEEVTGMVRGPAGTDVVLTMRRDGEEFDVRITSGGASAVIVPSSGMVIWKSERSSRRNASNSSSARSISSIKRTARSPALSAVSKGRSTRNLGPKSLSTCSSSPSWLSESALI